MRAGGVLGFLYFFLLRVESRACGPSLWVWRAEALWLPARYLDWRQFYTESIFHDISKELGHCNLSYKIIMISGTLIWIYVP